ncbi:MAG: right-handed parallel beta-helix repeat-containing protein [Bryobacterales bacterium]
MEPGDVVWLGGGVYHLEAPLECNLFGEEGKPIEVWGMPEQEPAVLQFADGRPHGVHIAGAYATYQDFEIRCSSTARWSDTTGSVGDPRGIGILSEAGPGVKLVRLRVRDFGTSLFESQPQGIEISGCIFSGSYWDAPDRSHGPGLYVRNSLGAPRKRIENNVIFEHGRQGLQGFGSTPFAEMDVVGNFFFNNGIADDGFHRNFMFGNASDDHRNVVFEDNTAYFPAGPSLGHEYNQLGGDGGSHGLTFRRNWLAHEGRAALQINRSDGEVVEDNRIVGGVEYTSFDGTISLTGTAFEARFPLNEYYRDGNRPTVAWSRVRRDASLPGHWRREGMAYLGIVNWQGLSSVEVDLSELEAEGGLDTGAALRIWPVQQPGAAVSMLYTGSPVMFPMTGWTPDFPAGRDAQRTLPSTFPELGVFCLEWKTGGEAWNREPKRVPDPGIGLPAPAAWAVRHSAWRQPDLQMRDELLAQRRAAWRAQKLGRAV